MELIKKYICYKCWKVVENPSAEPEILYETPDVAIIGDFWKYYCDSCDRKYYPDYHILPNKKERKF
jgi:hypothetical protein